MLTAEQKKQAELFDAMLAKLHTHHHVPNLDLMTSISLCRNCLSNYLLSSAKQQGVEMDKEDAKTVIYGMPYDDWWDMTHPSKA